MLKEVDIEAAERLLADWMKAQVPAAEAVAIGGRALRESCNHDLDENGEPRQDGARRQLSAADIDSRVVVGQVGCSGKKDGAEGAALRQVVRTLDPGTIVIADALHASRQTAELPGEPGLYCILQVKGNQPVLLEQLGECRGRGSEARTVDGGHGLIETRRLARTDAIDRDVPVPWLDFPGVRCAARIERKAVFKKDGRERKTEVSHSITSLPPELAAPKTLPARGRGDRGAVENGIHSVPDVALREDECRARSSALPSVMAAFANLAISIPRLLQVRSIKRDMSQPVCDGGAASVMNLLLP